jgi:hypothetical protein
VLDAGKDMTATDSLHQFLFKPEQLMTHYEIMKTQFNISSQKVSKQDAFGSIIEYVVLKSTSIATP